MLEAISSNSVSNGLLGGFFSMTFPPYDFGYTTVIDFDVVTHLMQEFAIVERYRHGYRFPTE
jgi:hypothetical protein